MKQITISQMAALSIMTALMCILGPLAIPIGAVPITLTNFVIYLSVYILGTKLGTISFLLYLLLGTFGLPVFSGYAGGIGKLAGPTGGYLIGFILMAILSGLFIEHSHYKRIPSVIGMILGTIAAYLLGTIWFIIQAKCSVLYALTVCVFPFLLGDFLKIILSQELGHLIRNALKKAHLFEKIS